MEKTLLGKIIAAILAVFISGFPEFVKKVYRKIPDELKEKLAIIIDVVEKVKEFVDSPIADIVTAAIPGNADDEFKEWLRKVLPDIIERYKNSTAFNPEHDMASELTAKLTGVGKGQAAITAEVAYQNK